MPDIPNVPGVPSLSGYANNVMSLLVSDVLSAISSFFFGSSQWGIFLDGAQAFDYNSVVDFDYKQDWPVSDYQLEDGAFQSYDKVQLPFDVKVRVVSGGSESDRESCLSSVLAAANTLELYDVVTPEQTFSSCNITHVDFKRSSSNGVGMIVMDIWFIEIRITSTSTFSNTQQPGAAGQQSTGNVSPITPNQQVQQDFSDGGFQ